MKYRKKPVVIEAQQFTDELKYRVYLWAQSIQMNVYHSFDDAGKPILKIPTLEGEMICSLGDYLILEPFPTDWRKIYPCKPDIFEKTYEPFTDATPAVFTAADLAKAREEGRRELEAKVSAMVAVLKDYERWEANLVMCDEAWRDRSYPAVFTEELYASFFSIQGKRNAALLAAGKKEQSDE